MTEITNEVRVDTENAILEKPAYMNPSGLFMLNVFWSAQKLRYVEAHACFAQADILAVTTQPLI